MEPSSHQLPLSLSEVVDKWNAILGNQGRPCPTGYVYATELVLANFRQLRDVFRPHAEVFVSLKANPHPSLARELAREGAAFDAASVGELEVAMSARRGVDRAGEVSLVGPGKSEDLLRKALDSGVQQIVVESAAELRRLGSLLGSPGVPPLPRILLRVNPAHSVSPANEIMGGRASQFGIDEHEVPAVVMEAKELGIGCVGLHFFLGSQLRSADSLIANVQTAQASALEIVERTGMRVEYVNLCGGFGIPHEFEDPTLDLAAVAQATRDSLSQIREVTRVPVVGMIEAGRYIYGNAGVYVCKVVELKRSRGDEFVIVDVGITGFSRPAVRWGEEHPIWKLGEPLRKGEGTRCTVVGPTCLPGDVLAAEAWLREPHEGDILVVGNAGAYGHSMSLLHWSSLPEVREVVV